MYQVIHAKKLPAVRTGQVMRAKKIACHPHRPSYPFEKNCLRCASIKLSVHKKIIICATGQGYPCQNNSPSVHFERLVNTRLRYTFSFKTYFNSFSRKCSHKILSAFCLQIKSYSLREYSVVTFDIYFFPLTFKNVTHFYSPVI